MFHRDENGKLNIVDGQQRCITLTLMMLAIRERSINGIYERHLQEEIKSLDLSLAGTEFTSSISKANLRNNYADIQRRLNDFDNGLVSFLMNKCEVVCFYIDDISEAFQFFDAQNARGKDLFPHDLLKAYHLREMGQESDDVKIKTVSDWEELDQAQLTEFFAKTLFRVRNWSKDNSAREFTKDHVAMFKGINMDKLDGYPYGRSHKIAHFYVNSYNAELIRKVDQSYLRYPFQLDQPIINGHRFFEMISHYHLRHKTHYAFDAEVGIIKEDLAPRFQLEDDALRILYVLNTYPKRRRTGDQYIRNMFDCALMYYVDRFGYINLSKAIKKLFIWAYWLRLSQQVIQLATMDNHVLANVRMFKRIREATGPEEVLSVQLPSVEDKSFQVVELKQLFKEFKYYHGV